MTTAEKKMDIVQAHLTAPPGMMFHDSPASVRDDAAIAGYAPAIERAWREMKLHGVLCTDGRPILYLKEHGRPFSVQERVRLQKLFWNQGLANILVLVDPVTVFIYSGLVKPLKDHADGKAAEAALIETLERAEYARRIQNLYHDLATGNFYEKNRLYFDPDQSVDSWLLKNLGDFRDDLIAGQDGISIGEAHAFIGRVLFLFYLLDRGIVSIGKPDKGQTGTMLLANQLAERPSDSQIDYLYELFENLRDRFNGNMFDQDLDAEKKLIRPHLQKLILFIGGHHVQSGQMTLVWPYDFKMIPIETISSIYQDFLSAESPRGQRKRGAFYTPRFLAEMVVDEAVRDEQDAWEWTFFDPACGSGMFLVILFNRLAARRLSLLDRSHYTKKSEILKSILKNQIRGLDIEETACRIACFSLYLAYLDFFDPPDIEKYIQKTGEKLPRLIDYGDDPEAPAADIPVIRKADFLSQENLAGEQFDCIIGNPPWEGRGSKQLALRFIQKAPHFLRKDGAGCLLLPTKILQNQTDAFQAEWLRQVTLEKVLQLADYRKLLFHGAKTPAFIALFKNTPSNPERHYVEFAAPKFNRHGLRKGVIIVNPSSRSWIPLADVLAATETKTAPVVWKRRLWGTNRDQKLLDLLQSLPPLSELAGSPKEGKRWIKGYGFQLFYDGEAKKPTNYDKPRHNPWDLDTPFTRTDESIQMILFKHECVSLRDRLAQTGASLKYIKRIPNEKLFQAPMILVNNGFSKIAFCEFDVLFQHSIETITGPEDDTNLLMFLMTYLRSNLAKYYLFHTSANWGTERDKVHLGELLRTPFPLPGNDFVWSDATEIINTVAEKIRKLRKKLKKIYENNRQYSFSDDDKIDWKKWRTERKKAVDSVQQEIEPLIYKYFGLTDQETKIIEDTINVFIPSSTPGARYSAQTVTLDPLERTTVSPYAEKGLAAYADTLTDTLNNWAAQESSISRVCAEGGIDSETGLAIVTIALSDKQSIYKKKEISGRLTEILRQYYDTISKKSGALVYERDILFFQSDRMHIIRPNILLNWTRTAAINDAARIYGEIAASRVN